MQQKAADWLILTNSLPNLWEMLRIVKDAMIYLAYLSSKLEGNNEQSEKQ